MLVKLLFLPAIARVKYLGGSKSVLSTAPIKAILREGWKEFRSSMVEISATKFGKAAHDIRLPILIIVSVALPVIAAFFLKKLFTFVDVSSEHGSFFALEAFLNYTDRHLILIAFVLMYVSQFFIWNPSLDSELSETFDGPQAGSIESTLLAKIRQENGMKRGPKLPAKKDIPQLSARIEEQARAAGLSLREYHRRKWLEQNGVRFEGGTEILPDVIH